MKYTLTRENVDLVISKLNEFFNAYTNMNVYVCHRDYDDCRELKMIDTDVLEITKNLDFYGGLVGINLLEDCDICIGQEIEFQKDIGVLSTSNVRPNDNTNTPWLKFQCYKLPVDSNKNINNFVEGR